MKLQISNCKKAAVQDGMIGLFFEDINYAADGGLYAEMIENRSFSFVDCYGDVGDYYTKPAWGYGWNATKECGEGRMEYVTGSPISTPTITGLDSFFMISFKDNSCPPSDLEVSNTPSVQRNRLSITTQKENATTATGSNISFTRGSPKNAIFPKRHWAVKIFLLSPRKCNNVPVRNPAPVSSGYVISA